MVKKTKFVWQKSQFSQKSSIFAAKMGEYAPFSRAKAQPKEDEETTHRDIRMPDERGRQ
jgi:hypothetical protein